MFKKCLLSSYKMHSDEFYRYLLGVSAEAAEGYLRYHPPPEPPPEPPPAPPRDLAEAMAHARARSEAAQQIPATTWYGLRHRLGLTCAQEHRMEGVLRHYL